MIKKNNVISFSEYKLGKIEGLTFFADLKSKESFFGRSKENYKSEFGFERKINDFFDIYIGYYDKGKFNGNGLLNTESFIYLGNFLNDRMTGNCEIIFNKKAKYTGNVLDGHLDGLGTYYFEDKSYFKGNFKNNLACGKGVIYYPNGDIFEGVFLNNSKNGECLYKSLGDKNIFSGFYDNGQEIIEKSIFKY